MAVGIIAAVALQKIWTGLLKEWGVMTVFTYWGGYGAAVSIDSIVFNEVMTKKKAA